MPNRDIVAVSDWNVGLLNPPGELPNPSSAARSSKRRRQSATNFTSTTTDYQPNVFLSRNIPHFLIDERIRMCTRRSSISPHSRCFGNLKVWCSEKWSRIKTSSMTSIEQTPPVQLQEPLVEAEVTPRRRSSSRPRKKRRMHSEETTEYEEALVVTGKKRCFKHFVPSNLVGFMYRKMFEVDFKILSMGEGYDLLRRLGLYDFLNIPVPRFDKKLCDEFLRTFDDKKNSGQVRGRLVVLNAETVALASKLPLGTDCPRAAITCAPTAGEKEALRRMLSDTKKCRGYNIAEVVYGKKTEIFQKLVCMLSIKLQCRKECFHFAGEEVLLALNRSISEEIEMNWADYLCTIIIRACKSKPTNNSIIFQFGEWLSKIIRNKLQEPAEGDDGMVTVPITVDNRGAELNLVRLPVEVIERPDVNGPARAESNPESSAEVKEIDSMVRVKVERTDISTGTKPEQVMSIVPFKGADGICSTRKQVVSNGQHVNGVTEPTSNGKDGADNAKLREDLRRIRERIRELEEIVRQRQDTKDKGKDLIRSLLKRFGALPTDV